MPTPPRRHKPHSALRGGARLAALLRFAAAAPAAVMTAFLMTAALAATPFLLSRSAAAVPLRLIAFNDFHGQLEPGANALTLPDPDDPSHSSRIPAGGAAWLGGLIGQLRSEAPNAMVFSSGDLVGAAPLPSTLFRHESTITVMNAIGLDFGVVGNHEFDAGADELRRLVSGGCAANGEATPVVSCALGGGYEGAKFPLLAANVEKPDGQPFFAPTLVKEFGGVRIGFIGVVTRTLPILVSPAGIAGLKVRDEAETINRHAAELKGQGVSAIVAVVHEGGQAGADWNDEACAAKEGEIFAIAEKLSADIDLVFSAHTHQGYNCLIDTPQQKGLRLIQATSYGRGVSVIDVELDSRTGDIDRGATRGRNIPVVNKDGGKFAAVPSDPAIGRLVDAYAALAKPRAERPVGSITASVERAPAAGEPPVADFPAGRMIADAYLEATRGAGAGEAQIALTNAGGVRAPLVCAAPPPCTVTFGQVFTMQPFGNSLVVMTLTGRQLKAVLEQQQPDVADPRFLQPSAGLRYAWKRSAPHGERVADLTFEGQPVQPEVRYRVTVNSFLAEGGDGFTSLLEGVERVGGRLDSEALTAFLGARLPYSADPTPRVRLLD